MAIVFAYAMKRQLTLLSDSNDPGALTVLAFDPDRWTQDLLALAKVAHLRIYAVPFSVSTRIHTLFFGSEPMPGIADYFLITDPAILAKREAQTRYATGVLRYLKRWLKLDCAANPAIHYIVDFPWMSGGENAGVPFVTAHKEFTVLDDRQVRERIDRWKNRYRFKFLGTRLAVTNAIAEKLFIEADVAPVSKVTRAGLLRFDNLLRAPAPAAPRDPLTVTLFSFGHLTGPFDSKAEPHGHYFTKHDDDGFVRSVQGYACRVRRNRARQSARAIPDQAEECRALVDREDRAGGGGGARCSALRRSRIAGSSPSRRRI